MPDVWLLPWQELLWRLGASFFVGALIGFERERHQRPAGLRTHILVSMASAVFAMISFIVAGAGNDPGRIAAQVVTGIGFLGAGTIMRHGSTVRGLTTAASLWMAAALGLAAGFGWYLGAAAAALAAFLVLTVIKFIEDRLPWVGSSTTILVRARPQCDALAEVLRVMRDYGANVTKVKFGDETPAEGLVYEITFDLPSGVKVETLTPALNSLDSIEHTDHGLSRGE